MKKIKVGIVGAAGYTGSELFRILIFHPMVEVVYAISRTHAGKAISSIMPDLIGNTDLKFVSEPNAEADTVFLCVGHGEAKEILKRYQFSSDAHIVDLSRDHRDTIEHADFVYGLPELNKSKIANARKIANPGCFATAIQLGLLPLACHDLMPETVHINAMTGSTGAGVKLSESAHFSQRHSNVSVYNVFDHPHLNEIKATIESVGAPVPDMLFVPQRGPFARGIMASITMTLKQDSDIQSLFENHYKDDAFTQFVKEPIGLKNVVNTNRCLLNVHQDGKKLLIVSFIDNLVKGASGQAVQNMNLMSGLPETAGLHLKPIIF